ncbi:glycosyltransferase family 2 protein [Mariniblastus fucicola]|uniref:Undecaprenyl-phosphate 4-deoxy-4-formamido-L-arabinose transferase n=1 Tax=Mariniblastus fucicola TaxID=980251 RepID=A0A5B9PDL5_9BACT|nr:glycosyltransferase family 2 protein [Mariniblastus fucicola]QEG23022.1 Undecaprenyl-phosphate 4-deoxy-4-formamido-L-arabinose transferase [Mariniblastus fucicola]
MKTRTEMSHSNQHQADEFYATARNRFQSNRTPEISFVIPAMNEEASLAQLVMRIEANVDTDNFEIILIDDGSTDDTWVVIQALADVYDYVRGLRFRSNRGKAAGLQAGFDIAEGDLIFTMDADLQDDPKEIPRFIEKINEGYDLVSGWKAVRHDPWHKVLPSRIFNRMLSYFSNVKLHDHNCGFKCYRREVAKSIKLFGELHRMVPSLAGMQGYKVAEIVVEHHARKFGVSKYGVERFIRGFSDMLTMGFLRVYGERPSHFANFCAFGYGVFATCLAVASLIIGIPTTAGIVTLMTALIFSGMGGACVIAGLFCELMIRQNSPAQVSSVVVDTREDFKLQASKLRDGELQADECEHTESQQLDSLQFENQEELGTLSA